MRTGSLPVRWFCVLPAARRSSAGPHEFPDSPEFPAAVDQMVSSSTAPAAPSPLPPAVAAPSFCSCSCSSPPLSLGPLRPPRVACRRYVLRGYRKRSDQRVRRAVRGSLDRGLSPCVLGARPRSKHNLTFSKHMSVVTNVEPTLCQEMMRWRRGRLGEFRSVGPLSPSSWPT